MIAKKILKTIKIFCCFKNPFSVLDFYRGNFIKGRLVEIFPKKGSSFFIARSGDSWLIDKIISGKQVSVDFDAEKNQRYIIENGVYLRQGTSDTYVYKEIFIDECYKKCSEKLNKKSIVIDIGAHIGLFSIYCGAKCGKIFAYEPHKENYDLAVKNIQKNGISAININNLAVWSEAGKTICLSDGEGAQTGEHAVKIDGEKNSGKSLQVSTISIRDIFINNRIVFCDLLKMDIEGAEYAALFAAPDEIFEKISYICLEYHPDLERKHSINDLIDFLKKKRFIIETKELKKNVGLLYAKKENY